MFKHPVRTRPTSPTLSCFQFFILLHNKAISGQRGLRVQAGGTKHIFWERNERTDLRSGRDVGSAMGCSKAVKHLLSLYCPLRGQFIVNFCCSTLFIKNYTIDHNIKNKAMTTSLRFLHTINIARVYHLFNQLL